MVRITKNGLKRWALKAIFLKAIMSIYAAIVWVLMGADVVKSWFTANILSSPIQVLLTVLALSVVGLFIMGWAIELVNKKVK